MIEEHGVVVAIDESFVWVEANRESACGRCAAGKGCGNAVFQKLFGNRRSVFPVKRSAANAEKSVPVSVSVGDEVVIGVKENAVVKNSFVVYAIPVVTIICFAAIGETFSNDSVSISKDLASILGAITGLVISIVGLRGYNRLVANKLDDHPVLLRRINSLIHQSEIKILG